MAKIKSGDNVIVLTGKDRGKQGKVLSVKDGRIVIEGINLVKKHQKPNQALQKAGEIITREAALDISNVAIFNEKTQKADRIGYQVDGEGVKTRIYKSTGEPVATAKS